jgi:hypothetical protein
MPLNKAKGNMYGFITDTWNPVKGICPHQCSYCYMRKWWPQMSAPRQDEKELRTKHGTGNKIFVGSGIDLFAPTINPLWIQAAIGACIYDNTYFFQSKNPGAFKDYKFPTGAILCTTIETNRYYAEIMGTCPAPPKRATDFYNLEHEKKMVTIEPILDFDIDLLIYGMIQIKPIQINIGADSGNNHLPEPSKEKLETFIRLLKENSLNVFLKPNLKRILGY